MPTPETTVEVMVTADDQASAKIRGVNETLKENQTAVSDLAMGTAFMGTALLSMAMAMENSNNQFMQGTGNILKWVGGVMTAVGSATYFIYAVSKMVDSLKTLHIWQILTQAFAGPGGWAKLAIGGAIAGAAIYGVTKATGGGGKAAEHAVEAGGTTINMTVMGNVQTERDLVDAVHTGLLQKKERNAQSGL